MRKRGNRLNMFCRGSELRVTDLICEKTGKDKLIGMGIIPGCRITVLSRNRCGSSVVRAGSSTIVIDSRTGELIICTEA